MTESEFKSFMKSLIIQAETANNLDQLRLIIRAVAPKQCVEEAEKDITAIKASIKNGKD